MKLLAKLLDIFMQEIMPLEQFSYSYKLAAVWLNTFISAMKKMAPSAASL